MFSDSKFKIDEKKSREQNDFGYVVDKREISCIEI
jgi:hypothetical protein